MNRRPTPWVRVCLRVVVSVSALVGSHPAFAVSTPNVVASQNSGLVLSAANTVCSLGQNDNGQLGDGASVDRSVQVQAIYLTGTTSVSVGNLHGLAVKSDGSVWSWGNNQNGQLGNGTNLNHPTPYPVPGLANYVTVAAGGFHSLALKSDKTVWAWGANSQGQLGDGTNTARSTPVQVVNLTDVAAVAASARSSYALKSDGTVWAWGQNNFGQLGDNTSVNRANAVQVSSNVARLATTDSHVIVLKNDGTVWGWGFNDQGQLGDGSRTRRFAEVRAGNLSGIVAVAAGSFHSLAIGGGGIVWAFGDNTDGQLGDGTSTARLTPSQVPNFSGATTAVAASGGSSYVLKGDGSVWTWGDNANGQLGIGTVVRSPIPVAAQACTAFPIAPGPARSSNVVRLTAGQNSSLALAKTNSAVSWGQNDNGQLGDATVISHSVPAAVSGVADGTDVSLGGTHGLTSRTNGTVASWGTNQNGELGDGTVTAHTTPITIPNLGSVVAVAAGQFHSLALKTDGSVWAWGNNGQGQLGDGSNTTRTSPIQVVNLNTVVAIAASSRSSYALKADGTVWAWGQNNFGQIGDNTTTNRANAVQVPNLGNVIALAAGGFAHMLVLKNDGTVWGWGFNDNGELGDGSNQRRYNIVRVSDLTNVIAIVGGQNHSLAIKNDGTVWTWGDNSSGQLGNGTSTASNVPVKATGLGSALAIAGGISHSLAILRDGTLWAWGSNANGQFGAAAPPQSTVPVRTQTGFGPFYTISLTQNAAGGSTVNRTQASSDGVYVEGTRVCFSPAPAVGWVFGGFPGNTVDATNCLTAGANGTVSAVFTATPPLRFVKVTPCRIADTRNPAGPFGAPLIAANSSRDFVIPQSACNIPSTAQAYALNFTVVPSGPLTFISAWPTGVPQPVVSVLNSFDGRVKANAAIVPAGANGAVSVYASDATNAIIDINGYFVPASDTTALSFYPVTPCRLVDTRGATGQFGAPSLVGGQARTLPLLAGACTLPASVKAYSLNITVIPKVPLTYLTVWPAGDTQPLVSTLNAPTGAVTANAAVVPAGSNGDIGVFATGATDLIVDVNGYFAAPGTGGLSLYNVTPCRVLDTRMASGGSTVFTGSRTVNAATSGCYIPSGAQSLVYNATVVPPAPLTYLTLWPTGQTQPLASTLNSFDAAVSSNLAIVPDSSGAVDVFVTNNTHLLLDISGYFANP